MSRYYAAQLHVYSSEGSGLPCKAWQNVYNGDIDALEAGFLALIRYLREDEVGEPFDWTTIAYGYCPPRKSGRWL